MLFCRYLTILLALCISGIVQCFYCNRSVLSCQSNANDCCLVTSWNIFTAYYKVHWPDASSLFKCGTARMGTQWQSLVGVCEYSEIANSKSNFLLFDYSNESNSVCSKFFKMNLIYSQLLARGSNKACCIFFDDCSKNGAHTVAACHPAAVSMCRIKGSALQHVSFM